MDAPANTDNANVANGTAETNAAETEGSLTQIMGDMADKGTPETKPADSGEKAEGTTEGSQDKAAPAWTSQLSDEIKTNEAVMKQLSKFDKITDLAKSYSELEGKLGKSIVKPGKDASTEEVEEFYQKLGKPKSMDKYSITGEDTAIIREIAFNNNLTDDQCKAVYEQLQKVGNQAIEQQQAALMAKAAETEKTLKAEYGKDYATKIKMLQRGVDAYGGNALGQKLKNSGLLYDPDIVKMFVQLGEQNAEAGTTGKTARGGEGYKTTAEGGQFSWIQNLK